MARRWMAEPLLTHRLPCLRLRRSVFGAFSWQVWVALFVTIFIVGLLLGIMQRCSAIVADINLDAQHDAAEAAIGKPESRFVSLSWVNGGPKRLTGVVVPRFGALWEGSLPNTALSSPPGPAKAGAAGPPVEMQPTGSECSFSTMETQDAMESGAANAATATPAATSTQAGVAAAAAAPKQATASRGHSGHLRRILRRQLGLRRGQRLAFVSFMGDHVWQAAAVSTTMSEGGIDPPGSVPGRIVYVAFLFLMLVMIAMFTANTGAGQRVGHHGANSRSFSFQLSAASLANSRLSSVNRDPGHAPRHATPCPLQPASSHPFT